MLDLGPAIANNVREKKPAFMEILSWQRERKIFFFTSHR